ncbi:hypothetical protein CP985_03470 [Malaciobacter mytili LMG 24559]|uniref:F-type type IV conjugative transfer system protein TraE n=1 Tax=Malaciobacter mytili LMG 24559 TaxID=1032238 RepID=A0AAX2AIC2_9BACT|nr:TraE/TraK family type IV conjugative transfer system protein [Malaciobacter mytili]AXH16418.1 F-type type IV conjugative transfer system protein TraE [Malaciobacter mytili LMG 24559]RXK16484.1 hypothetical protein CP985_03470 [Malaciobacter mytili LMG 24559]
MGLKIFGKEYEDDLETSEKVNLSLWRALIILTIVVVVLVTGYLDLKSGIKIEMKAPPENNIVNHKNIIYGLNGANVTYYELWGRYLIRKISNFQPDNVNEKMDFIFNEMRPTDAVKVMKEAEDFKKFIIANKISQKFEFLEVTPDLGENKEFSENAIITIKGISKVTVGSVPEEPKECIYQIALNIYEGVFYVKDYGTNCFK